MGLLYDFSRLIGRYGTECELTAGPAGGSYVGGEWIPDAPGKPRAVIGIVIPMPDRMVLQSGGAYTEQDRDFITEEDIPLEPASSLVCQGVRYRVESEDDHSIYAGFHNYHLKRVGAIDRSGEDS